MLLLTSKRLVFDSMFNPDVKLSITFLVGGLCASNVSSDSDSAKSEVAFRKAFSVV